MLKHYIGVKQIQAEPLSLGEYNDRRGWKIPEDEDPAKPGYLVVYPDGYLSWSPAEVFESAYLSMGDDSDGTTITPAMVDAFVVDKSSLTMGEKTTVVKATLANGFEVVESSSCVDPSNYDEKLGVEICEKRIQNEVWKLLGFLLQAARNGIKN